MWANAKSHPINRVLFISFYRSKGEKMILDRLTPCAKIEIKMPRWKQRVVGIANFRVKQHNEINITAKRKDGSLYYPEPLYATGDQIRAYETQTLPSGVKLYLVPINSLETLERSN